MEKASVFTVKDTEKQTHRTTHTKTSQAFNYYTTVITIVFTHIHITLAPVFLCLSQIVVDFPVRFYFGYVENIW